MSISGRLRIRWRPKAKDWLDQYVHRLTPTHRRTLGFTFDRRIQQIAQFPYSGQRCGTRFDHLSNLADEYRVVIIQELLLIYYIDQTERMIILVHLQTTTMDTPTPEMLIQ
jgi:plasmid stabilization system protein ParE